ncbi:MAG: 30S ribosomal protein S17 [Candidatus Omnitrophica bacterium CG12_big_fil_rev_8_21_14_0_65_43_15]|uniref:Small ribosomal subunit protein uS17 n=1 Tax=Candidatus Taenaricola geysiri TaxID=1974752 RepID=A0A2J0LFY1_9BACT|nr:MAG: 30S ribosomal protein S17 [Candidatus Omnitrophica bacterium CG1_02_43_210]PIR66048.1 MAG: 30S ribosomal protein S17 [Candidatus Omnitrophica bacterium CG10_big_fil_rev_8_21_14_0_10_43_8]PIV12125.1 MAG: 30S ribosomal protein S17 [Candidatus Omnitrophica bacterium CG03_land_8_20_14_0_80_43_22]PIW66748.1 MAG: 30S ribosomal protein S17 [Candidatus Omnitrophica bacterium CG12_big_fil_rev_8_21_14_0_65_43_15]PIW79775.1 MAG: 30S ribosomal protein S17 [Candidatus Omnitrophica bacterium CG_4_8_1
MPEINRESKRKIRTGEVVSDKMNKTIVVMVQRTTTHPVYNKIITKAKRYKVHDEQNQAKTGDKVRIAETRRLSKDKRWRLLEVIK